MKRGNKVIVSIVFILAGLALLGYTLYEKGIFTAGSAAVTVASGVTGPTSSTDNAVARFNGTGGSTIQNSGVIIDDSDNITGVAALTVTSCSGCTGSDDFTFDTSGNAATSTLTHFNSALISTGSTTVTGAFNVGGLTTLTGNIVPETTDGSSLGTSALNFSDMFIDSGGVINFDSGNMTITHSAAVLDIAGGSVGIASSTPQANLSVNGNIVNEPQALTDGATITIDWSTGNVFFVTLAGNRAVTHSNVVVGQSIRTHYTQDSTGSRLFPAGEEHCLGGNPTLSTGAGETDIVVYTVATSSETIACTYSIN